MRAGLAGAREKLRKTLRSEIAGEQAEQLKLLNEQLEQKSQQVRDLNRTRAEVEKLKREKAEVKDVAEFEAQKKLNATLVEEREKIRRLEAEKATLALSEKEIVIQQLRDQLQEASKKAEQGSTQLQGEAQELAIEDWLAGAYPLDTIEEIKKGARGGDCLQIVNTQSRRGCGSIYYESKRTKHFQPAWIEKFKADIREKGASIGVLVTDAMPADMEHLGMVDGVWVCSFSEFKGLSQVLRSSIIDVSRAVASQENRGDKMQMLYAFLTSDEFRHQVEGIVEGLHPDADRPRFGEARHAGHLEEARETNTEGASEHEQHVQFCPWNRGQCRAVCPAAGARAAGRQLRAQGLSPCRVATSVRIRSIVSILPVSRRTHERQT